MNQLNVFAAALVIALILGSFAVFYAGKRAGRQDALRELREAGLAVSGESQVAGTGAAAGGLRTQGSLFDAPQAAPNSGTNINQLTFTFCGAQYMAVPVTINGVEVLSRIGAIADASRGLSTAAGRLCDTLAANYRPGESVPTVLRQADGFQIGAGMHVFESFDIFVIDPLSGDIRVYDRATRRAGESIGSLY